MGVVLAIVVAMRECRKERERKPSRKDDWKE